MQLNRQFIIFIEFSQISLAAVFCEKSKNDGLNEKSIGMVILCFVILGSINARGWWALHTHPETNHLRYKSVA